MQSKKEREREPEINKYKVKAAESRSSRGLPISRKVSQVETPREECAGRHWRWAELSPWVWGLGGDVQSPAGGVLRDPGSYGYN